MYIVTGGAGFIGSVFARKLNLEGIEDLLIVDELGESERWKNLRSLKYLDYQHKDRFLDSIVSGKLREAPKAIIHMGACSSTTERNADYMLRNNYQYTKTLCEFAVKNGIRFIYASSAATYGDGAMGYDDNDELLPSLAPLNVYGYSKHLFDLHAERNGYLNDIVGLKFFNVFGPNEYHKEDMRSVVLKAYHQIKSGGEVKLFRSYRPDYADGEQKRDFVYVKDCIEVMWWLLNNPTCNGLFNLGTGKARSWNDLVRSVYKGLGVTEQISYIDMPETLRSQYQYFTQASMKKLEQAGCPVTFRTLEASVKDYVSEHLERDLAYA